MNRSIQILGPLGAAAVLLVLAFGDSRQDGLYEQYVAGASYLGARPVVLSGRNGGMQVLYSSPSTGKGDIVLWTAGQKGVTPVVHGLDYEGDAALSRDGGLIAFTRERRGESHIWIATLAGGRARQVTRGRVFDFDPAFTPDGREIVFSRGSLKAMTWDLFVVDVPTGRTRRLVADPGADYGAVVSRDNRVFYSHSQDGQEMIRVVALDGSSRKELGTGAWPGLSPDGQSIVFTDGPYAQSIGLMKTDGTSRRQLFQSRSYKSYPSFSSDGKSVSWLDEPSGRGVGTLLQLNLNGGVPVAVVKIK